jgi:hypothetical protein
MIFTCYSLRFNFRTHFYHDYVGRTVVQHSPPVVLSSGPSNNPNQVHHLVVGGELHILYLPQLTTITSGICIPGIPVVSLNLNVTYYHQAYSVVVIVIPCVYSFKNITRAYNGYCNGVH